MNTCVRMKYRIICYIYMYIDTDVRTRIITVRHHNMMMIITIISPSVELVSRSEEVKQKPYRILAARAMTDNSSLAWYPQGYRYVFVSHRV
jgi:hypothetical protein